MALNRQMTMESKHAQGFKKAIEKELTVKDHVIRKLGERNSKLEVLMKKAVKIM